MAPATKGAESHTGPPTIATIAAHTGLSRSTVTHVLNGRAAEQRIRPETRQRVLQAAQELGYRANASARAIRAGRFGSVALVQSQLGRYLPAELLNGLTTAMAAQDLQLVLTQVANVDDSGESYLAHTMRALSVDGVFINRHGDRPPPFLAHIRRLRIPAIFLNSKQDVDCIYPDDLRGGELAAEALLRLGHERIAYVETEERSIPHYSERDRRAGYERAMRSAGRAPWVHRLPIDWRSPGGTHADQRVEAAVRLLNTRDRPTAVVAYELTESMAVVRASLLLGLRIPEELSLIHFHSHVDERCFLPIHTVSNMMQQVGEGAVSMLLEKIENPNQTLPSRAVPEVLLEGATCMPPGQPR
ncbi:MAG: LacI family DNA-binding transcriptional regulator [Armatimonadota bacterium]